MVRIRIHSKDSSNMDFTSEEMEKEEVSKTDRLTSERSGAVVNKDNYYMSTTAAINLKQREFSACVL